MIITSGTIGMSSEQSYSYFEQRSNVSIEERSDYAVKLDISDEAKSLSEQLRDHQKEQAKQQKEQENENMQNSLKNMLETQSQGGFTAGLSQKEEIQITMLRKLLEALRNMQNHGRGRMPASKRIDLSEFTPQSMELGSSPLGRLQLASPISNLQMAFGGAQGTSQTQLAEFSRLGTGSKWTRTTVQSAFVTETENTAFTSAGMVNTADGRSINFDITVEMSRAFCAKNESFTQQEFIMTDPLVINLDTNNASVTDMKFLFDLDEDGKEESISFAGKGSGFLALDKNGDGVINNGSELFGTKSGDGFKDLAQYDEDGNGWIDEADSIFDKLKVWTKDEDGNDKLIDLKKADVGAIFLGKASTDFSLNNSETNQVNAAIRSTGVFLRESGSVGTIQHVDIAI